jgi:hypothetical protein
LCICVETTVIELYQYQGDIEQGRYRYNANRAGGTGRTQVGSVPSYGLTAEYAVSLRDEQVRAVLREDRRDETAMKTRLLVKLYFLITFKPLQYYTLFFMFGI